VTQHSCKADGGTYKQSKGVRSCTISTTGTPIHSLSKFGYGKVLTVTDHGYTSVSARYAAVRIPVTTTVTSTGPGNKTTTTSTTSYKVAVDQSSRECYYYDGTKPGPVVLNPVPVLLCQLFGLYDLSIWNPPLSDHANDMAFPTA
jgi:hypothetical protein